MMRSSRFSIGGRKGQDSWEIIKWFPRIFILMIIVMFCYYLFVSFWDIDYDTKTARSAGIHPKILYGMTFSDSGYDCNDDASITSCALSRPNRVYLENFNSGSLERIMSYTDDNPTDTLVQLHTAPFSAKIMLEYVNIDGELATDEIYLNERDYNFYKEQLSLDPSRYGYSVSTTSVTVILDDDLNENRGILTIEAIVP